MGRKQMLQRDRLKKAIREQVFEIRQYNRYGRQDMLARNMIALKLISLMGLAVTLFIFILPLMGFDNWAFMWHYWVLIPVYTVFLAFSIVYDKKQVKSFAVIQTAGVLFSVMLIATLAGVSIIYYPDKPDEMLVFVLVLIPLFFSIETWVIASITVYSGIVYCILAYSFKDPSVLQHDIFSVSLSVVLSLMVLGYNARLRANGFLAKEKYKTLSRMDLLTELLNKKSYELWCQRMLNECGQKESCALVIFDLDNFKQINDNFGHIMGDRVLEIVGQTLAANFHTDCFVGRIGGDEFSAFSCADKCCELFARRAENVIMEVKERARKELKLDVTMSMGITKKCVPVDYMELYFEADKALYEFKQAAGSERRCASVR